jgi:hypothetical protein
MRFFPDQFVPTIKSKDPRLPLSALVYGIVVGDTARAYPFADLREHPVVEETVAGAPVTVWFDPISRSAGAFDPRLSDRRLTFTATGGGRFVDRETGSRWDLEGRCIEGPLAGKSLAPLHGLMAEWYGWYANRPATTVWRP